MKTFRTLFAIVAMAVAAVANASATCDLGQIVLGQTYPISESYNFGTVTGTVTATSTGTMTVTGLNGAVGLYADADHYNALDGVWNGSYGANYAREYEVVGGQTYYAYGAFVDVYEPINFLRFEMTSDIEASLSYAIPGNGAAVSPITNDTGEVVLSFTAAVTYQSATLSTGQTSVSLGGSASQPSAMQYVQIGQTIRAWQGAGILAEEGGQAIALVIEGLQTSGGALYNGTGRLQLNYVASPKLPQLISDHIPSTLKSYYPAGDPQAIATFTFDKELKADAPTRFTIGIGNVEAEGAYYLEEIPVAIQGPTVTVDFAGKLRELNYYAAHQGSKIVEARLMGVYDIDGNKAEGAGGGLVGSYAWNMVYDYIEPADIVSEFTPPTGASLQGVNTIEIWFNHADLLTFDGVRFECPAATAVVPLSELDIADDAGGKVITVAVPASIKGRESVTVTLNNLVSLDGYNHSSQIRAQYDQFVATLVAPIQPGQSIASTGEQDFVITANGEYGYLRYSFYNKAPTGDDSGWAYGTEFVKQSNGTWTAYNPDIPCYVNYDPRMVIEAWMTEDDFNQGRPSSAQYVFTFQGLTPGFTYSSVTFVSIDPEDNSRLEGAFSDFCFTVTFDGLVRLDAERTSISLGFGSSQPFAQLTAVEGEDGYANTWLLYPGDAFMNSNPGIDFAVVAYDQQGMMVRGNMGGDQYDYLSFSYIIANSDDARELTVTPQSGTTVEEVSYYIVSYPGMAVGRDWNHQGQMPTIYDRFQAELYVFAEENINIIDEDTEQSRVLLTVDPAFTAEGAYVLFIPGGFFVVGDRFDTKPNAEYWGTLFIEGAGTPTDGVTLQVSPEPGHVDSLKRIDITSVEENIEMAGTPNMECEELITITDDQGNVIFTESTAQMDAKLFDWDTWQYMGFYLEPNITADGVYVLDIPARFISFYYGESYSKPLVAVYTVGTDGITSVVIDKADRYEVYSLNGAHILSTGHPSDLSTLAPGLYIINGRKILIK